MITQIVKGVVFKVKSFTGKSDFLITFTHRDKNRQPVEGLTREAIYMVLIDHIRHANNKRYSRENEIQLDYLERCLQSQKEVINDKVKIGHIGV